MTAVRVYYEDTDAGGVVYYANYLKYLERGRTEFLRSAGFEQDELLAENIVFAVKKVSIDYQRPARFNDLLQVETKIHTVGKASMQFHQQVQKDTACLADAQVVVVCLAADTFKPRSIPEKILTAVDKECDAC